MITDHKKDVARVEVLPLLDGEADRWYVRIVRHHGANSEVQKGSTLAEARAYAERRAAYSRCPLVDRSYCKGIAA